MEELERISKFICIPVEIWESTELSWDEKYVFIQIYNLTSNDTPCHISNEYIANYLGKSERTAKRVFASLIDKKLIVVTKFDGRKRYVKTCRC